MRMMCDEDDAHKNDEDDAKKKVLHSSSSSSKHSIIYIDANGLNFRQSHRKPIQQKYFAI